MPENYSNKSACFRFFWKCYAFAACALMLIELASQAVQITISIDNVETLTTCTLSTVYILQFLLKMMVFKKFETTFTKIFDEMSAISSTLMNNPVGDKHFLQFYNKYYKKVMRVGITKGALQVASNIGLNLLFCILSWVGMKRKITAAFSWTPYDSTKNPGYTITCIFEMLCYVSVTARSGVLDLLFWVMLIVPTIHLTYLKHLMKIIIENEEDFKGDNNVALVLPTERYSEENFISNFDWWIKQHQRVLG